jgi:hypothetical protein
MVTSAVSAPDAPAPVEPDTTMAAPASKKEPADPKKKPAKRYRPPGPPFHEKLYSQSGRIFRVRLEVPQEGEECPLTLSPMAEDTLDFLRPETTYFAAFPAVKKMVLPCGHGFGALQCLYHLSRRNMLCPCCRRGVDSRLSLFCMPAHLRGALSHKVSEELRADNREAVEDNAMAAAAIQGAGLHTHVFVLIPGSRLDYLFTAVTMTVDFLMEGENRPRASMVVPLSPAVDARRALERTGAISGGNPQMAFTLPSGQILLMLQEQLGDRSVVRMRLQTLIDERHAPDHATVVGSTGEIDLSREAASTLREIQAGGGSFYRIRTVDGDTRISSWEWIMPENFVYLAA